MGRNRPRILATNSRMKGSIFENSWSIHGWSLGRAKVNALRELQVKSEEQLRLFVGRTLMPSILDKAFEG